MTEIIVFVLVALAAAWGVLTFNRLVRDRNRVTAAWSDIDVQLQRRHDLIPRLVDAVRAYADYERTTLETVTELRARSIEASQVSEIAALESRLEAGLHRLVALAESYPDLKANESFLDLQRQLTEVEDHLQYARRFYNGAVRLFNTRIQSVPDMLIARPCGFVEAEFFDAEAGAQAPVRVELT
jgi:LemA protein